MLFAHVRGFPGEGGDESWSLGETKFVSLRKSREFVGITIGDTGTGFTLIKVVHPRSDAFYAGLKPGDVIVSLVGPSSLPTRRPLASPPPSVSNQGIDSNPQFPGTSTVW